jgi:hypothetical protein
VWRVLTDFAAYPEWNPFIVRIGGDPAVGQTLDLTIHPPGRRVMTFHPKVLRCEPNRELRWLGHLLVPGLFDGEHSHVLDSLEPGRTRYRQSEAFRGLLVPLTGGLLAATQQGFDAMNTSLKARAEALAKAGASDGGSEPWQRLARTG